MNTDNSLNHLVRREPGVHVERTDPNFDHLAWFTLRKLLGKPHAIGEDGHAVNIFHFLMRQMPDNLTAYVSPWSVVTATEPDHKFLTIARSEQRAWHARLRSMFFDSHQAERYFGIRGENKRTKDPVLRQLEYHGILIVAGEHIFPNCWPRPVTPQGTLTLVGQTFGRLTVIADLPHRRHRCQCECGNFKEGDRNHLRAGRMKSCGCLAKAQKATNEARRHGRGR
jgi:hypothetical protein